MRLCVTRYKCEWIWRDQDLREIYILKDIVHRDEDYLPSDAFAENALPSEEGGCIDCDLVKVLTYKPITSFFIFAISILDTVHNDLST